MREISEEMRTLLKSKKMIGENRPTHEITINEKKTIGTRAIGISPPAGDMYYMRTVGHLPEGTSDWTYRKDLTNFVVGADGREFCIIRSTETDELYLGHMENNEDYFIKSHAVTEITPLGIYNPDGNAVAQPPMQGLFKRKDGKILLFINYRPSEGVTGKLECFISNNGLGTDFQFYSTVFLSSRTPGGPGETFYTSSFSDIQVALCREAPNGDLWLTAVVDDERAQDKEHWFKSVRAFVSRDGGQTWQQKCRINLATVMHNVTSMVCLNDTDFFFSYLLGTSSTSFVYSTDGGDTWKATSYGINYNYLGEKVSVIVGTNFAATDHVLIGGILYRMHWQQPWLAAMHNPSIDKIKTNDYGFDELWKYDPLEGHPNHLIGSLYQNEFGNLVITFKEGAERIMGVKISTVSHPLQAKKINIQKQKGMAGGLSVEFDNKNGLLAPDGEYAPKVLWPNNEIVIKQGYGDKLVQTFKGYIDSIKMTTFPQTISITARDALKMALDQMITSVDGQPVVSFLNKKVEEIWTILATRAGLEIGTVEETGLTIEEKIFSWETYGDAFSWLDEIAGFETFCDWEGKVHFIRDGRPDEIEIAYTFREGEDIISLEYEINDRDLYSEVVVFGRIRKDEEDEPEEDDVIEFHKEYPAAEYSNLLPGKILRIDAPDADTEEKCEIIADRAIYLMTVRGRTAQFQSVGIPHLERGDFIQVMESSTTISEIYRITNITTNQDEKTYTMNITCYHHAAPEVIEE